MDDRFCLFFGPNRTFTSIFPFRLEPDAIVSVLEEVRAAARERGVHEVSWWVGEASEPPDLAERLRELGLAHDEDILAMAILEEPAAPESPAVARRVESIDELSAAEEAGLEAFESNEERRQAVRENLRDAWAGEGVHWASFAAFVDGEIVGIGRSAYLDGAVLLIGGGVVSRARGHGAYRALVRARWDDAVARGTPALIVHAGKMSRPILERLGFEAVCRLEVLEDMIS